MRIRRPLGLMSVLATCSVATVTTTLGAEVHALPDNDVMMKAIVTELDRSMEHLVLDGLPKPYFMQYNAEDRLTIDIRGAYGGLVRSHENRYRTITSHVRVGSFKLDNTNLGRGFGVRALLPVDDDYVPLRQAVWRATDEDYKRAVELLARKQAYLKQKSVEERPDDFSPAEPVRAIERSAEIGLTRSDWERTVQTLSARFKAHPDIRDSDVTFFAGAVNNWVVNSDGTRLRTGDFGVHLKFRADIQAEDGMELDDSRAYLALGVDGLPPVAKLLADVDDLCNRLVALSRAAVLEHYTGPVLFEPAAAGRVFEALLADGLSATPIPLGGGNDTSFGKKIGRRILPRSFHVFDDSTSTTFDDTILAGSYTYDDEGVPPSRVELVEKGVLKTLVSCRAPTKEIKKTTGHCRGGAFGDPMPTPGCLYVESSERLSAEELRGELIQAARDEGLEYGLRVESMEGGRYGALGRPIFAYKVYVEDGREELVRGLEFQPVEPRSMKHILAAGSQRKAVNSLEGVSISVISPAVLFEELDLSKTDRELDKRPFLPSPLQRDR